jgi:hypothetical protein
MVTVQQTETPMAQFEKGNPGGPGRPKGSRNKLNRELDQIAEESLPEILRNVAGQAKGGEQWASKLILQLPWRRAGASAEPIDLPEIADPESLSKAQSRLIAALAAGEVSIKEAAVLASMIELHRRAVVTLDQERRLEEIETALGARNKEESGT